MILKEQVLLILMMALFYLSVPVSRDSVTVSQHAQHQHPEAEASTWDSANIMSINVILLNVNSFEFCFYFKNNTSI